jgi:hypothetical protein
MPVPAYLERGVLHVGSRVPLHPMRRRGVHGTLHDGGLIVVIDGLPVLAPADAWVDLAPFVGLDDLVAAGDWVVTPLQDRPALVSLDRFVEEVDGIHRRRGIVDARRALALVRVGAWSPPETHLRLLLGRAGLPEPALNAPVSPRLIPDLSWREFRVASEYNGEYHEDVNQVRRDLRRAEEFALLGWTTVNVDRHDRYRAPASGVARVVARMRSRGWNGNVP